MLFYISCFDVSIACFCCNVILSLEKLLQELHLIILLFRLWNSINSYFILQLYRLMNSFASNIVKFSCNINSDQVFMWLLYMHDIFVFLSFDLIVVIVLPMYW